MQEFKSETNILIAYYSWSGNTKKIAEYIQQTVKGEMCEIIPVSPYSSTYAEVLEQGKKEIQERLRPSIQTGIIDISSYDILFVGSPNWWGTIAPPVAAFLEKYDISGMKIVPFCTHGGGGKSKMIETVEEICKGAEVKPELVVYNRGSGGIRKEIGEWAGQLNL